MNLQIEFIKISKALKAKSKAGRNSSRLKSIREYVWQTQPARRFLLFSYLDFRVYLACYPPESVKIICLTRVWSKCVDTSFHGHSSQTPQQNPCRISHFSKKQLRYANNRPGTGTSHIIGQNLWAKFGVTQSFALKGLKHHGKNVSQFLLSMEAPSTWPGDNL